VNIRILIKSASEEFHSILLVLRSRIGWKSFPHSQDWYESLSGIWKARKTTRKLLEFSEIDDAETTIFHHVENNSKLLKE